ncbi:MAG: xanthine dehydrogenase family protein [Deltaproteobacteria bacterium]|nr:xanthine dehydrogenase family protein [Deltaproteobacteria bacterium]
MQRRFVGQSVRRVEAEAKVTGAAQYIDDLTFPEMLFGVTVRSAVARGTIRAIEFADGIPWAELTIVTAKQIPGKNRVALIADDQPMLADGSVNHAEEPVVLLAHHDRALLEAARRAVHITIDPLPAMFDLDTADAQQTIVWGTDNILKSYRMDAGDIDAAWATAAHVIEGEYRTGAQEHMYIEPQGVIAIADPNSGVTVWGSLQCPYYVHAALLPLFGLPADKVRVVQTETGGGFGGKEEYPSLLAGHAALLAWHAGKPVKMMYDRREDMAATTKRHPSRTRIKTGFDRGGKLVALDIDFVLDGGAYTTLSPVVLSRGTLHATGPYRCPNVRIRSRAVATNSVPYGAFRGFGAPQSLFAIERHMDRAAHQLRMAPEELRRRNLLRDGDTLACGQTVRDGVDLGALLDRALQLSHYHERRAQYRTANATEPLQRGLGIAAVMHGAGFTGSGEQYLASKVAVETTAEGRLRVLAASTEMGQGKNTVFTQIAADAAGLELCDIDVVTPDTQVVPNSGPTVASRTTMIVGDLVARGCTGICDVLRQSDLLPTPHTPADFRRACAAYHARHGALRLTTQYEPPPGVIWDDATYRGQAYATYAWAVYIAEVSVDPISYEVRVTDFTAVQEIGRVVNPTLAAGQIEGGVVQAIGYALYEQVQLREGRMVNDQFANYIIPTALDVPPIRVHFEEVPYAHGQSGAKGIGELPMDAVAPAILNAVEDATGVSFTSIPLLPEEVLCRLTA